MINEGDKTFKLEVELSLSYHALFALASIPENKTVNELLVEILTNDPRIKKLKKKFDDLPPEPENFGLVPHPNSSLRKIMKNPKWKAVKKKKDDFLPSHPWKATNGYVCSDHKTKKEAMKSAKEENERDGKK